MTKTNKLKVILLTITSTLAVGTLAVSVLSSFNVIHVGLGEEKTGTIQIEIVQPADQSDQTAQESDTTSTTEPDSEDETTTAANNGTTKKGNNTTKNNSTTTTKKQTGDNDGDWVDGWY